MSASKLHDDQLDIDEQLVRQLLRDQFPQWSGLPLAAVPTAGTENAIYRLGDQMAVRLPYRPGKKEQIDKLDLWLPKLAPRLPLAIPTPVARGEPTKAYPAAWSVVRWLEGEEATLERLDDPVEAARTLAEFVRSLMALDTTGGPAAGRHNFSRGVPLAARDEITRKCIRELEGLIDTEVVTRAWEHDLAAPVWSGPPTWLHGDLSADNLLSKDGRLSAVLDWGGLGVGDPATELQPAWNLFRGESRDAYRDAVGLDDATWARGRGVSLSVAIVALPYYKDTNPYMATWASDIIEEVIADSERRG